MKKIKTFVFSWLLLSVSIVWAQVPENISDVIKKNFKTSLPSLNIDSIESTPINNLYQVTSGPVVMYVTEDGRYAISGDVLDLSDGETNLTEESRKKARLQALDKLGEDHMIVFPSTKVKYQVTVFTDMDCVYCRKFHAQIESYNKKGITVRYVAFPRAGDKSTSYDKAVSVWCSDDPKQALTTVKQGQPIPSRQCEKHMVDEQFHLGVMTGISGTPSIILDDGTLVPGYFSPDSLMSIIKETEKKKHHS